MKKIIVTIFALAVLAACNTIDGMGRDLERAGEKVQGMTKK